MIRLYTSVGLISLLGGCETMASKARVNPNTMAVYAKNSLSCPPVSGGGGISRRDAINLECFTFPKDTETAYVLARKSEEGRTRLEAALLKQADDICELEKGRMFAIETSTNAALSIATTVFSTVSTIVTGQLAKSILSGGAAISSGSKDHVNANFYRNQIIQAITKVIDGERSSQITSIIVKRQEKKETYPAEEMIRLVNRYHQACSFQNGTQKLLDASINLEGYKAIIEDRNLRTTIRNLKSNLETAPTYLSDEQIKPMTKLLGELMLRQATPTNTDRDVIIEGDTSVKDGNTED